MALSGIQIMTSPMKSIAGKGAADSFPAAAAGETTVAPPVSARCRVATHPAMGGGPRAIGAGPSQGGGRERSRSWRWGVLVLLLLTPARAQPEALASSQQVVTQLDRAHDQLLLLAPNLFSKPVAEAVRRAAAERGVQVFILVAPAWGRGSRLVRRQLGSPGRGAGSPRRNRAAFCRPRQR